MFTHSRVVILQQRSCGTEDSRSNRRLAFLRSTRSMSHKYATRKHGNDRSHGYEEVYFFTRRDRSSSSTSNRRCGDDSPTMQSDAKHQGGVKNEPQPYVLPFGIPSVFLTWSRLAERTSQIGLANLPQQLSLDVVLVAPQKG